MRKIIAGLSVACLLAVAAPSMSQAQGMADPLGLAAVGVVVPFFGSGSNLSFLEIASPVGDNVSPVAVHLVFFNFACTRGESFPVELTENDFFLIPIGGPFPGALASIDGVVAVTGTRDQLTPEPLQNPVHTRVHWADVGADFIRVFDPIIVQSYESPDQTWNPLRTGATFFAPHDAAGGFRTTIYFVCPSTSVTGLFPSVPAPAIAGTIRGVVFDLDEGPLRDITTSCGCLTPRRVFDLSLVYTDSTVAPDGTWTELYGGALSFTGYRAISEGGGRLDSFGRLSNASDTALRGGPANGR